MVVMILSSLAAFASVCAAILCLKASSVRFPEPTLIGGQIEGGFSGHAQHELAHALRASSQWNHRAAIGSILAAVFSAFALGLHASS
jgi:hypothetical protein